MAVNGAGSQQGMGLDPALDGLAQLVALGDTLPAAPVLGEPYEVVELARGEDVLVFEDVADVLAVLVLR